MTTAPPEPTTHRPLLRVGLPLGVATLVVVADQLTKTWALHHLHLFEPRHVFGPISLELTFNAGAAFGLGRGVTPVVEAVVVLLIAGLVGFGRRMSRDATVPTSVGLGLLIGGALSNLGDRVFRHLPERGSVVDFIDAVRIGHHDWWPVFNVADAAIVVGAILLALAFARRRDRAPR